MPGRLGPVIVIPVNGPGADGTHFNADAAEVAPRFIDNGPLGYPVLNKLTEPAAGTVNGRGPVYFKAGVEEGINVSAYQLDVLRMESSQSSFFTGLAGGQYVGIEVDNPAGGGIQSYGVIGK